ncbi:fumarylacetoacetate hydrolase family protein [Natrinema halophilum]|uniref:fumarylacetoacetate hydrolase family protein n=1 Tax=Natrinema halophilum TaxID=1699371 RepID=UPI001F3C23C2|nr:fumarylacetoacetate hydrolase family protein [Natrinema halophilum]UHQ96308.1 fumarylacetoacetate hydrolase family protein [Natrinema halophilum]
MRRARFRTPSGRTRNGTWTDRRLEAGGTVYRPDEVTILPPTEPTKIVGVSTNNYDLVDEYGYELPDRPKLFLKPPNTVSGHGDTVSLPSGAEIQYEAELAVVIDTQCRHMSRDDAMSVVGGFTILNDLTDKSNDDVYGVRFKAFDNSAVVGPVIVDPDAVPDDADIELQVNGQVQQTTDRSRLRFGVPEIIEEVTRYMTLEPGDLIATGTTSGADALAHGDDIEIEIEGIGTLEHGTAITDDRDH